MKPDISPSKLEQLLSIAMAFLTTIFLKKKSANKKQETMTIIEIARQELGKCETPKNSNWGPDIEKYLRSVGIKTPAAWCMAFVHWVVEQYCIQYKRPNPLFKTGGVLNQLQMRKSLVVTTPQPGDIFIMDYGGGKGHTGFIEYIKDDTLYTIEGNSNDDGSNNGYEVCRGKRQINTIKAFLRPIFIE